ncbi:TonB-dependent siderophore receptor [Leisingera thetidis]|uniref:TonB-dependent siderophore receptor n=1 Tax=Leisingera thetidis TaxID=2930199 RepID=UPI0021F7D268|nr:TonB-dependent siderophore receptor [Leisingera thetidis]
MTLQSAPAAACRPALRALLCGTALGACAFAALPAAAEDGETVDLAPIIVRDKLQYAGAVDGYLAPATETGVKSGVPLSEVPQSVSVVTSAELERRHPAQVEDAVKFTPGINPSTWGTDDRFDQFSIRGFDMGTSALYRDGLPNKSHNFASFKIDPYMLDRIEVLRGPAGVLYGSNDAGGMVNLVTKRPGFGNETSAYAGYGSFGTAEAGFDASRVLNAEGTLAGRLTVLLRDGATEADNSHNDRKLAAGSLTWAPTDDTSLTVLMHLQQDERTPLQWVPEAGVEYDAALGSLPEDFHTRQSPFNSYKSDSGSIGWEFSHRFGNGFTFNQKARYAREKIDYRHLYLASTDFATGDMTYTAQANSEEAYNLGFDNYLEWKSGGNSLIVGVDYQRRKTEYRQYLAYGAYPVSFADPVFDFSVAYPPLSEHNSEEYTEKGIYLQDHFKFANGLSVTAGLRRSWFENEIGNLLTSTQQFQKNAATTGMLGLTYEMANGLAPYISYTEGFIQNFGKTIAGAPLDPSESKQWEAGLRYLPDHGSYLLSAAIFDLRKTNVKDYDRNDPTWSSFTQAGEIRARGLELEARGRLSGNLQGVFGYTYLDTEITKSLVTGLTGNDNAMAPPHQLSLWLDYDASDLVPGLSVGGGLRYNDAAFATQSNARVTPSYTLADLALRYEWQEMEVNLRVSNLFDRDYDSICYDGYGCSRGEGRTVSFTIGKTF